MSSGFSSYEAAKTTHNKLINAYSRMTVFSILNTSRRLAKCRIKEKLAQRIYTRTITMEAARGRSLSYRPYLLPLEALNLRGTSLPRSREHGMALDECDLRWDDRVEVHWVYWLGRTHPCLVPCTTLLGPHGSLPHCTHTCAVPLDHDGYHRCIHCKQKRGG